MFSSHELIAWVNLHTLFFNFDKDMYIGCVYLPPEGSTYKAASNNYLDILEVEIAKYSVKGHVLLCRDFNARTAMVAMVTIKVLENTQVKR